MKLCIFGSRQLEPTMTDIDRAVEELVACTRLWLETARIDTRVTQVISGGAHGADLAGEEWARRAGVQLIVFPADWKTYGARAGSLRNGQMADGCDAAIGFWNGHSRGTHDMIGKLRARHRPYLVVRQDDPVRPPPVQRTGL